MAEGGGIEPPSYELAPVFDAGYRPCSGTFLVYSVLMRLMTELEAGLIEDALEACLRLWRDGFVHGPGSHFPEMVFTDDVPLALTTLRQIMTAT